MSCMMLIHISTLDGKDMKFVVLYSLMLVYFVIKKITFHPFSHHVSVLDLKTFLFFGSR